MYAMDVDYLPSIRVLRSMNRCPCYGACWAECSPIIQNHGFNIPAGSTIQGVEVKVNSRVDSPTGSPRFCILLSLDGGTTWTTAKTSATLSTAETVYILGAVTDAWGRTWTKTDFNDANFRVRLVMVASNTSRDFSLDWVGVQVRYTP